MPISYPYTQYGGIWKLNAASAAQGAGTWPTAPSAPTIGSASIAGLLSASVSFTPSANSGTPAGPVTYTATSSPGGITATSTTSPITLVGLTALIPYTFTITATGASGLTSKPSAASNSITL